MNQIIISGHVGQDPDIHTFDSGDRVAKFSVNDNEGHFDNHHQWVDRSSWHNITVFENLWKRVSHKIHRGSKVLIIGKLIRRKYQNSEGEMRDSVEIRADKVEQLVRAHYISESPIPKFASGGVEEGPSVSFSDAPVRANNNAEIVTPVSLISRLLKEDPGSQ